jgi:hypothetical protein
VGSVVLRIGTNYNRPSTVFARVAVRRCRSVIILVFRFVAVTRTYGPVASPDRWVRARLVCALTPPPYASSPSLLLGACGTDSATEPDDIPLANLAGSWQVVHWEYSRASNPSEKSDRVALLGLSGSLAITAGGRLHRDAQVAGGFAQVFGQLTLQADSLYWAS